MDHSSSASASATTSSSSSQRGSGGRELQGPRPAPLKVRKDSHKIRKPPQQQSAPAPAPPVQVRQPVIIYTVSPKVVHANPSEFMSVVQRLTGARTAASASLQTAPPPTPVQPTPTLPFPFQVQAGPHEGALQLSPAARLAAIEQARSHGGDAAAGLPPLPSILSPVPGLLPAIPASFFSPPAGGGTNLLGELISPAFLDHRNYSLVGGNATFSGAAAMLHLAGAPSPSPSGAGAGTYYWDLFNNDQQH